MNRNWNDTVFRVCNLPYERGGSGGAQTLNRGPNDMVVCVCNLPYERGSGGSGAPGEAKGAAGEAKGGLWKASVFALRKAKY